MKEKEKIIRKPEDIEKFRIEKGKNSFDFTDAVFKCEINFSKVLIENKFDDVSFEKAVFEKDVHFEQTEFLGFT